VKGIRKNKGIYLIVFKNSNKIHNVYINLKKVFIGIISIPMPIYFSIIEKIRILK
jgi:hypothetical protein